MSKPNVQDEDGQSQAGRRRVSVVVEHPAARVLDLGDGVALFELKTKLGVISNELINFGLETLKDITQRFDALVVANPQKYFSLGANLSEISDAAEAQNFDAIERMILRGQEWMTALRGSSIPVVTATHGFALGGGCELVAAGWATIAHSDARIGLVESNVGLVPGWGGVVEQLRRRVNPLASADTARAFSGLVNAELIAIFEQLRTARVANSPGEAKGICYLRAGDRVVSNRASLTGEAKREALTLMALDGEAPTDSEIFLAGADARQELQAHFDFLVGSGVVVGHDVSVGERLIVLLTGAADAPAWVDASLVRAAERKNLVELAATEATQERIVHTLETGKTLKN